jgi:hypothetical protein
VKYRRLNEADEPELLLSLEATKAFIQWAQAKGMVGRPDVAQGILDTLEGRDV